MCYYRLSKTERRKEPKKTRISFCQVQSILLSPWHTGDHWSQLALKGGVPLRCKWVQPSKPAHKNFLCDSSSHSCSSPSQMQRKKLAKHSLHGPADGRIKDGRNLSLSGCLPETFVFNFAWMKSKLSLWNSGICFYSNLVLLILTSTCYWIFNCQITYFVNWNLCIHDILSVTFFVNISMNWFLYVKNVDMVAIFNTISICISYC